VEREIINPWGWQDRHQFVQASVISGATRMLICSGQASMAPDGQTLLFTGTPDGAPGHYVAQVSFPSAGSWEWTVYQGPFEPQELGVVSVLAPAAAAAAATPSSGDGLFEARAWRVVFPAAALLMALLFALQLVALTRERRGAERAGAASEPATAGD
jgi:hypothetical protein